MKASHDALPPGPWTMSGPDHLLAKGQGATPLPSGLPMPTVRRDRAVVHGDGEENSPGFGCGDKMHQWGLCGGRDGSSVGHNGNSNHGVTPAQAGAMLGSGYAPADRAAVTATLRLGRYLGMGTGLRRYDIEWVEGLCPEGWGGCPMAFAAPNEKRRAEARLSQCGTVWSD